MTDPSVYSVYPCSGGSMPLSQSSLFGILISNFLSNLNVGFILSEGMEIMGSILLVQNQTLEWFVFFIVLLCFFVESVYYFDSFGLDEDM